MTSTPADAGAPADSSLAQRARSLAEALVRYAAAWIDDHRYLERHRRFIEELEHSGELDGLLEVTGITREQLRVFELSPLASAELLSRMLERIGLTRADLQGEDWAAHTPELRCRSCSGWRQCRRWLDSEARDEGYREFCPNAELLDEVRSKAVGR